MAKLSFFSQKPRKQSVASFPKANVDLAFAVMKLYGLSRTPEQYAVVSITSLWFCKAYLLNHYLKVPCKNWLCGSHVALHGGSLLCLNVFT